MSGATKGWVDPKLAMEKDVQHWVDHKITRNILQKWKKAGIQLKKPYVLDEKDLAELDPYIKNDKGYFGQGSGFSKSCKDVYLQVEMEGVHIGGKLKEASVAGGWKIAYFPLAHLLPK